jgi:secreted trypsin-like serine protease
VSWGEGCAREKKAGVYANAVWYKDWIQNRTASVNTDEDSPTASLPPENPNPNERDKINTYTETGKGNKGANIGFANGLLVLSFVAVLTYLFN